MEMKEFIAITKALSDENRVRIILALGVNELCVCQIIKLLSLAPSTVSKHISILKQAGLVDSRKDGRWIYYRLADGYNSPFVKEIIKQVFRAVGESTVAKEDKKRLESILKIDKEELCRSVLNSARQGGGGG